ncbi:MAG: general stress protein [Varibaculum sp.]|nr:general stress protein [Varibaculum sp.]
MRENHYDVEIPRGRTLGSFNSYAAAEAAVNKLIAGKYPAHQLAIVGDDLTLVEQVTGALSVWRVIGSALLSGVWFGLLIGLISTFIFTNIPSVLLLVISVAFFSLLMIIFRLLVFVTSSSRSGYVSIRNVAARTYRVVTIGDYSEAERILAGSDPRQQRGKGGKEAPDIPAAPQIVGPEGVAPADGKASEFGSRPDEQPRFGVRLSPEEKAARVAAQTDAQIIHRPVSPIELAEPSVALAPVEQPEPPQPVKLLPEVQLEHRAEQTADDTAAFNAPIFEYQEEPQEALSQPERGSFYSIEDTTQETPDETAEPIVSAEQSAEPISETTVQQESESALEPEHSETAEQQDEPQADTYPMRTSIFSHLSNPVSQPQPAEEHFQAPGSEDELSTGEIPPVEFPAENAPDPELDDLTADDTGQQPVVDSDPSELQKSDYVEPQQATQPENPVTETDMDTLNAFFSGAKKRH